MIRYENQCVGCPTEKGCLGSACPNRSVEVYYCDKCNEEIYEDVYEVDGKEFCEECLKDMFRKKFW
jgi:hypothetical protein